VAVQLADLQRRGYLLIVITNQAGINRGQYSVVDFLKVNARMVQLLKEQGVKITSTLWCPHAPEQGFCRCRKPGGELFREARVKFNLDLKKSFMIGDKPSDVIPGIRSFTIKANTPQAWPLEGL
jgi:D-glycero-D-manno-heptose 1,7-bisphosphate phosphatase